MSLAEPIQFFAATDVGRKRAHNEDNFLVDKELGLFVVADGMGGHAAGEVASSLAVRTIHEVVSAQREVLREHRDPRSEVSTRQLLSLLEYAVRSASARVHSEAQRDKRMRGMGTTISLLLVVGSNGYVAHVGDSRIYLVRNGDVHQVTEDHTIANELLRLGVVEREHLNRVPRKNAITRAVGVYQHVEVDTLTLELLPNDQFLISSDGLSSYFDDTGRSIGDFLSDADGDASVQSLIDFANEQGGKDNITAVLVRLGHGGTDDRARARRLQLKRDTLAAMPLFSRLNERELLRVMQVADVHEYDKGDVVMREGEPGDRMFVTLSGRLQVSRGNAVLDEYGAGDHMGEMALIRSATRSATVTVLEASELISLKRDDFYEIIRAEPPIAVKLLWQFLCVLADRLEQTSRDLTTARERRPASSSTDPLGTLMADDPFSRPLGQLGSFGSLPLHFGTTLSGVGPFITPTLDAEQRLEDSPSFQDAPQLAERILGETSFEPAAPARDSWEGEEELPHTRRRAFRVIDEEDEGIPFDAKRTRPGVPRRTTQRLEPAAGDAATAKTIRRPPQQTLPSAVAVPPAPRARAGTQPSSAEGPASHDSLPGDLASRDSQDSSDPRRDAPPSFDSGFQPRPAASPSAPPRPSRPASNAPSGRAPNDEAAATPRREPPARFAPTVPDGGQRPSGGAPASLPKRPPLPPPPRATPPPAPLPVNPGPGSGAKLPVPSNRGASAEGRSSSPDLAAPADESNEPENPVPTPVVRGQSKTMPLGEDADPFRPTKVTIPLDPPEHLRRELDTLRQEFRERLRKTRKDRKQQDSD
jgi:serine/threonine protein phosphatase PrpC/CRP-like cAMP-binding protein